MRREAIILYSGGFDSTLALLWALDKFNSIQTITFNYGQRATKEIEAASRITSELGIKHSVVDFNLRNIICDNVLFHNSKVLEGSHFIVGRNIMFLSMLSIFAYQSDVNTVITGLRDGTNAYPDTNLSFISSMEDALKRGLGYKHRILNPLMDIHEYELFKLSNETKNKRILKELSYSCAFELEKNCDCIKCKERSLKLNKYFN